MFTLSSQVLFEALTSEPSYDNYRERGPSLVRILSVQCIQFFFSKTLFDFKKSISGLIELKFSGKTPNEVLYAPIYFWGVYF